MLLSKLEAQDLGLCVFANNCVNGIMHRFSFQIPVKSSMLGPILSLGSDSNSSVCLLQNGIFHLSEPMGDLSFEENFAKFAEEVVKLGKAAKPDVVASDMHPCYISSEYAQKISGQLPGCRHIRVQHHKAHLAACALEHGLVDYVGIVCDGLGYGDDGTLWGGEIFRVKDSFNFVRIGHLQEHVQVGGDSAAVYPRKMLFGILNTFLGAKALGKYFSVAEISLFRKQIESGFNTIKTSSAGRLLDAVSSLLGVCHKMSYNGEPAILLERLSSPESYPLEPEIISIQGRMVLDTTVLLRFLVSNLDKDKARLASTAQSYIAKGLCRIAFSEAEKRCIPVIFTGGVAANRIISGIIRSRGGLLNMQIPCGDAGISIGQAYLASFLAKP